MPQAVSEALVAALPSGRVRFESFSDGGHGLFGGEPERAFAVLQEFVAAA